MWTFVHLLDGILRAEPPAVVATLVQVKGSSYRLPGARMLMDPEGVRLGVLSAGCMETDLVARVARGLEAGRPQVATYDMGSELDRIWGTGMGCEGKAEVLLVPVKPGLDRRWAEAALEAHRARRPGVLITVYACPDADRLGETRWWEPGLPEPLAPGLEAAAARALATEKPVTLVEEGTACLVEPVLPPVALWIYGAGENARPLADLACGLGWDVGILDHRPALASPERFPRARRVLSGAPPVLAQAVAADARSAAVVMAHVFDPDKAMLRLLLDSGLPYVGLQGNRRRTARLLQELAEDGFEWTGERLARLHAPMGLDLGAPTPEIIALSVLVEIQAVIQGRSARPLRELKGSIHG